MGSGGHRRRPRGGLAPRSLFSQNDLGTGKDLLAIELARRGFEVVAIDVDNGERKLAQPLARGAGVAGRVSSASLGRGAGLADCVATGRFSEA